MKLEDEDRIITSSGSGEVYDCDEGRTGDGDRWIIEVDGQGIY